MADAFLPPFGRLPPGRGFRGSPAAGALVSGSGQFLPSIVEATEKAAAAAGTVRRQRSLCQNVGSQTRIGPSSRFAHAKYGIAVSSNCSAAALSLEPSVS